MLLIHPAPIFVQQNIVWNENVPPLIHGRRARSEIFLVTLCNFCDSFVINYLLSVFVFVLHVLWRASLHLSLTLKEYHVKCSRDTVILHSDL